MVRRMLGHLYQSLYLKIFLSFLATCILLFIGLAIFWNAYFTDLFYKDKRELLQARAEEIKQVMRTFQDGTLSSRELRFGLRLTASSFNGEVWIVDSKGDINYSSSINSEGQIIPKSMDDSFDRALRSQSGFTIGHLGGKTTDNYLTYFEPMSLNGTNAVMFFHTPVDDIASLIRAARLNIWVPLLFSLIAVGMILYILSRKLAGPLQHMNRAALALAEGDFEVRVPISTTKDEIRQLSLSFNFMAEKLQEWEDTRQDFLANVSHELRSPLTTLRGLIVAMNDQVIPADKVPHYLQICDHEVQRLQRLVSQLLDLARIQNAVESVQTEPLDAISQTKKILDVLFPVIRDKGIKLEVWIPHEPKSLLVQLDKDRYTQVLNNLIYNAVQFTPSSGSIYVTIGVDENQFVLAIRDTGIGMSEDELKRIWDRFYKADPSRGSRTEGTGLGLTITKHLVEGMKGTIEVSSKMGEGTEFIVRFPRV